MDTEQLIRFGAKVKNLRTAAKMTGSQLAESVNSTRDGRAHVSKSYISDIENGRRQPREEVTREIARVLGTDPGHLVLLSGRIPSGVDVGQMIAAEIAEGERNGKRLQRDAKGAGKRQLYRGGSGGVRKGRGGPAHKTGTGKGVGRVHVKSKPTSGGDRNVVRRSRKTILD